MPNSNDDYDSLLTRLNALRTSSPSPSPSLRLDPLASSVAAAKHDRDIESRFRRLASGSKLPPPSLTPSTTATLRDTVDNIPSEREVNFEDEHTLDELLRELGSGEGDDSWLGPVGEGDSVEGLLKEARDALPKEGEGEERENTGGKAEKAECEGETDREDDDDDDGKHVSDHEDEDAAEEYIAQILADIELRRKQGDLSDSEAEQPEHQKHSTHQTKQDHTTTNSTLFDLPTAPSTAPLPKDMTISDDDLTARLAALSLPTTPSTAPTSRNPTTKSKSSNFPKFTDEDIESWCIICSDDATLKCLGCDGDLYCGNCWNEGHRGEDAGWEEKRHKAVVYGKEKGKKKALIGAS
ncbi:hypothetical protein EJ08DRAFT_691772 [Tothia fuscella]|uniref:Uncharacterized protein n=1 Tax=Tothia fuscella TaxID=1048955 RepID=A0A9P4U547_9PEZI|nr:hypothetical protein EJ08DRAFT_691772 [Tothia fuscella]